MIVPRISRGVILAASLAVTALANSAPAFRLNTLGYLPDAPKQATVQATPGPFSVVRASDGEVVLAGELAPLAGAGAGGKPLSRLDFSALHEPGVYRLRVPGAGDSPEFRVASDVFRAPLVLVTRAMYLWRCGVAVAGDWQGHHFAHGACHTEDAWLDFVTGEHQRLPSTGGWHDAGDYNKYVVNAGVTVGAMLRAWEEFPALRSLRLDLPRIGRRAAGLPR